MKLHHIALATALAAGLAGHAQANLSSGTSGLVTTFTENFDGGSSFAGGALVDDGADDYLLLNTVAPTASYTFNLATPSFAAGLASVTLSFWYAGRTGQSGSVTFAGPSQSLIQSLGNTPGNVAQWTGNNPGDGFSPYDAFYSTTITNLAAGLYTLTFASGNGTNQSMKLDDVKLVVTAVPEPGTWALMLGGLGALAFAARRRRAKA